MPLSSRIKGLIVGLIGASAIFIYFYRRNTRSSIRKSSMKEDFIKAEYNPELNSNFNHYGNQHGKEKTYASVAIGKSDVTASISSRNSLKLENPQSPGDSTDDLNYGRMGLKNLDDVIGHLESSINRWNRYESERMPSNSEIHSDSHLLLGEMRHLLEEAYRIREKFKQKLIMSSSSYAGSDSDDSSNDSFVSAREYYQDDSIINEYMETTIKEKKYLFKEALSELENGAIYYRTKRTELVNCQNDTEYLAKLYCLRSGFEEISFNEELIKELEEIGLEIGCAILLGLGYDTDSFQTAYHNMITFLHSPNSLIVIKEELSDRGVETVSLYDILFDFILLDALESLENPPSSLVSVINNRWLSEGFKKTTLSSSIWTILLAKRKFLKYKSGFKAHFYDIMDVIGAPLAWSFLGSETKANQIANAFKDHLTVLIRYLYSDSPRLTNKFELAEDIMLKIKNLKDELINELGIINGDNVSFMI